LCHTFKVENDYKTTTNRHFPFRSFLPCKKLGILTIRGAISDFIGSITFDKENLNDSFFDASVSAVTKTTGSQKRISTIQ